jgi:hypothetical protein
MEQVGAVHTKRFQQDAPAAVRGKALAKRADQPVRAIVEPKGSIWVRARQAKEYLS